MAESPEHFDYIFTGAGCAALSLITRMIDAGIADGKKILLLDKDSKTNNDRTWCFWEIGEGYFDPVVYRKWERLSYYGKHVSKTFEIDPYVYKMIRGIDFYHHCFNKIRQYANISIVLSPVKEIKNSPAGILVNTSNYQYTGEYVFNSIPSLAPQAPPSAHDLLQHFKGWIVETESPVFDDRAATIMDFRLSSVGPASFIYTLPLSAHKALVEYTLFSRCLLPPGAYDEVLQTYIGSILHVQSYAICEEESGVIPMLKWKRKTTGNSVIQIGTAGGLTKGSTGYTFRFIQKHSEHIINQLKAGKTSFDLPGSSKFHYYDRVLLNVLASGKPGGERIFTDMFMKNNVQTIFSFLDNESSLSQDLALISSLPFLPFLRAGVEELVKISPNATL